MCLTGVSSNVVVCHPDEEYFFQELFSVSSGPREEKVARLPGPMQPAHQAPLHSCWRWLNTPRLLIPSGGELRNIWKEIRVMNATVETFTFQKLLINP